MWREGIVQMLRLWQSLAELAVAPLSLSLVWLSHTLGSSRCRLHVTLLPDGEQNESPPSLNPKCCNACQRERYQICQTASPC